MEIQLQCWFNCSWLSQNHRMVEVGRDIWRSSRDTYRKLPRTMYRWILKISKEGNSTTSLGNLLCRLHNESVPLKKPFPSCFCVQTWRSPSCHAQLVRNRDFSYLYVFSFQRVCQCGDIRAQWNLHVDVYSAVGFPWRLLEHVYSVNLRDGRSPFDLGALIAWFYDSVIIQVVKVWAVQSVEFNEKLFWISTEEKCHQGLLDSMIGTDMTDINT